MVSYLTSSRYWLIGLNLPLLILYIFVAIYTITFDFRFACVYGSYYFLAIK